MHASNVRVQQALDAAGITAQVRRLPESTHTAAAAAQVLGCEVGAIANSLVFMADGSPILVMASGAAKVDTDLVAGVIGVAEVRRATADEVRAATGFPIGGVAPVGHPSRPGSTSTWSVFQSSGPPAAPRTPSWG
jgi:prolyl-tRNA editing enzyme YbaK/EbsC (Cys-tRNA(Pro) deacylase)